MSSYELDDADEKRFNEDLQKAIALSLETQELERIRNEQRKLSIENRLESLNIQASTSAYNWSTISLPPPPPPNNSKSTNMTSVTRSECSRVNKASSLPPPPAGRKSQTKAPDVEDLITFNSPTKVEPKPTLYPNLENLFPKELVPSSNSIRPLPTRSQSQPINNDVFKAISKRDNNNLIDLIGDSKAITSRNNVCDENSLLEIFDPFAPTTKMSQVQHEEENGSDDGTSESIYGDYNPFEYIMEPPKSLDGSDIVEYREKKQLTDPENRWALSVESSKQLQVEKIQVRSGGPQIESFCKMVTELRAGFVCSDSFTNVGLVLSPTVDCCYKENISVKLVVNYPGCAQNVVFTCNLDTTIEHVVLHVVCELERELLSKNASDYVLKVTGLSEYIPYIPFSGSTLSEYEYVHQCIKLERDVSLTLVRLVDLKRPLARTADDDQQDVNVQPNDLLPLESNENSYLSYETLIILLETLEREIEKVTTTIALLTYQTPFPQLQYVNLSQVIKAITALMGHVETLEITYARNGFIDLCKTFSQKTAMDILSEQGPYSKVSFNYLGRNVQRHCDAIREAVKGLIESYSKAFPVDFKVISNATPLERRPINNVVDPVILSVGTLHNLQSGWNFSLYQIELQIFHGTRALSPPYRSDVGVLETDYDANENSSVIVKSAPRVIFDHWFALNDKPYNMLPRESRFVFILWGLSDLPSDHELNRINPESKQYNRQELGWTAVQCFDHVGTLNNGNLLLSIWPPHDIRLGPAPETGTHPIPGHPILHVRIPLIDKVEYYFPEAGDYPYNAPTYDISSLDKNSQQMLLDVAELTTFTRIEPSDRELIWEKRHYLHNVPQALPKVLSAASSWDYSSLIDLHAMISVWKPMEPLAALQLLLPNFADGYVRSTAVSWIKKLSSDELTDYLPQLVEAYKCETYDTNSVARFLLERALTSPRFAHHLYWILVNTLPNEKNIAEPRTVDPKTISKYRYQRRLFILLRALLKISGAAMVSSFGIQTNLTQDLYSVAQNVKRSKDSQRLKVLQADLEKLHDKLQLVTSSLPLSASISVNGIHVRTCSYFPSNTLPLKLNFLTDEHRIYPAIFKVGDDLQQDVLTLQMLRIMDKLWLKDGLDLKMVTFACVPTGPHRGMIELVEDAETLRKIHTEHGLTGSFKESPIAEWLAKHNAGALEYQRAVENFTASCAGYCVATYVLGICDRHNDNIMLKTSGHLFHIDFGKFLGDAQMIGNFKRDRAPFVLTKDMAYVINGGDRPSQQFQSFVDLCCRAFFVVRKNEEIILNILGFMVTAGIPGVTQESMRYVQQALLPNKSAPEAAATFARMIDASLKSWFTQFNFFLHNIAQLRFTADNNSDGTLLSFVPRVHTMQEDGRITSVRVYGIQKRYETEKYYIYILRIGRINQPDDSFLFRTYSEFSELHQKICTMFPLAKVYSLPAGIHIGRSNIKLVAEERKIDIEKFIVSLFKMADEVAHSDIVYTFFHPLLRDQQETDVNAKKLKEKQIKKTQSKFIAGEIRLSILYQRGTLQVMIHHIRGLSRLSNGQEPNTYVKTYLRPDKGKVTKRKTKVIRKNCHPTFMEMLEYRLPFETIVMKKLTVTIWSYDSLQENEFLGGVVYSLDKLRENEEVIRWFDLGNITQDGQKI